VVGTVTKKTVQYVVLNFQRDLRNVTSFLNLYIHLVQRLRSVIMMRTSISKEALKYLRRLSQAMVLTMQPRFVITQSLFIRNVLTTLSLAALSLLILSLNLVSMRTAM